MEIGDAGSAGGEVLAVPSRALDVYGAGADCKAGKSVRPLAFQYPCLGGRSGLLPAWPCQPLAARGPRL